MTSNEFPNGSCRACLLHGDRTWPFSTAALKVTSQGDVAARGDLAVHAGSEPGLAMVLRGQDALASGLTVFYPIALLSAKHTD